MKRSAKTSTLLARQQSASDELNARFAEIFRQHRAAAFFGRQDQLFREHWTPEMAAAGYQFSGYEVRAGNIILHGTEIAAGFAYHISIEFPDTLADKPAAIRGHFEHKYNEAITGQQANPPASALPIPGAD